MICAGSNVNDETMEKVSENFEGYDFLRSLKLENTSIVSLDFAKLKFAYSVRWIRFVNNSLLENINFTQFSENAFSVEILQSKFLRAASIFSDMNVRFYNNLHTLKINDTKINRIPDFAFKKYFQTSLTTIDFQNNLISTIGKNAFQGLTQVESINLAHNQISFIDGEAFSLDKGINSEFVLNIDLSNNLLTSTSFNKTAFSNIKRPVSILFAKNNLKALDENIFKPLLEEFALTKLDLRDNPFNCDCSAKWIVMLPNDQKEKIISMVCEDGRNIMDFTIKDFENC
jgi:Leucine-rich repeat (LRR) protein